MSGSKRYSRANLGQSARLGGRAEHSGAEGGPSGSASSAQPPGGGQHNPMSIYIHHVPQHSPAEMAEVLAAVETLYRDDLRPYGRILRKRLTERAQATGRGTVDIDVRLLRDLCATSPWLYVQEEEAGDWSALLRSRPASFVDVYSPHDVYPAELWQAAETYFGTLNETDMVLPGGRYLCAQVLAARQLPFLAGQSLGQICHIVQLAISQKKILGYLNGAIVPYSRSQSMVKERCAENQRPCSSAARKASTVANWDTLRACIHELLRSLASGVSSIPLSNVKRLFRSRFHIELSETALGYAKLSELFQDERLRDVCYVRLQGQGYVIISTGKSDSSMPISLVQSLSSQGKGRSSGSGSAGSGTMGSMDAQPAGPSNSSLRNRARWIKPLSPEDIATPQPAPVGGPLASPSGGNGNGNGNGGSSQNIFPPTPSPTSMRAHSLPTLLGNSKGKREGKKHDSGHQPDLREGSEETPPKCGLPAASSSVGTAPVGPMASATVLAPHSEHGLPSAEGSESSTATMQPVPVARVEMAATRPAALATMPVLLTPSTLGNLGFMVQNTFIHAAMPPPTPFSGPSRAHSLPRNLGSDNAEQPAGHR